MTVRQVAYDPTRRIDTPVDYRALWIRLRDYFGLLQLQTADRAAGERDDVELRRQQGAYEAYRTAQAEMERLLDEARTGEPE